MTIPLDRLYHYIENVAQDIRGDTVVIYRFSPHGSKKIEDLTQLKKYQAVEWAISPHIYCNDQEPLDYKFYQQADVVGHPEARYKKLLKQLNFPVPDTNFKVASGSYDKALLLHSEKNSVDVELYRNHNFIPVYYWSHALISLEWFRYANHIKQQKKKITKQFLIYNRAWSGTREYRLKFVDLLIKYKLHDNCKIAFNAVEPELQIHYKNYTPVNPNWLPSYELENYFLSNSAPSYASADFNIDEYYSTEFEVVLETLFDDSRIHLTEKSLRPIALGQPFLLTASSGSLAYLRSYGFKTFNDIIDESYDTIQDPVARLEAVVNTMKQISNWTELERQEKMHAINKIVSFNKEYFFSDKFFNLVVKELKINLATGLDEIESTNTGQQINFRKKFKDNPILRLALLGQQDGIPLISRADLAKIISYTRKYYQKK